MSDLDDFVIEGGILTKYVGPGGDVFIPDGVTEIDGWNKTWETLEDDYSDYNDGPGDSEKLVTYSEFYGAFENCTSLKSVTFPGSMTKIGREAFSGCSSIKSITIPPNITEIGWRAFFNCTSLKNITIPPNITKVGYQAFHGCPLRLRLKVRRQLRKNKLKTTRA